MAIYKILGHDLEIIDIKDFKKYYLENLPRFNAHAEKSFLKAVDIPPSYFLEQPEETKITLLNNKEERINSLKKYADKCIIILWKEGIALNACRMGLIEAEMAFEQLSTIEDVKDIIWTRTFYKEGFLQGYIPISNIKKDVYNKCLVVDFPILLNKPAVLHEAFFKLPNETAIVDSELIYFNSSVEVDFTDFQHIALAIEDKKETISKKEEVKSLDEVEDNLILREPEEVLCILVDEKIIPKSILCGVAKYISKVTEEGSQLSVNKLTEILLSYEGNLKSVKQINSLRYCYNFLHTLFDEEPTIDNKTLDK